MFREFKNISIRGVSAAVPDNKVSIADLMAASDKKTAFKVKRTATLAGLSERYVSEKPQLASDLAIVAARNLMQKLCWAPETVGALFYVTQSPDFVMPASGYKIHHHLKLDTSCVVTDITASCSGMLQGVWLAAAHIAPDCSRALVLAGDITNRSINDEDIGNKILFGEAVGAIALEFDPAEEASLAFQLDSQPDMDLALVSYGSGLYESDHPKGFAMVGEKIVEFSTVSAPKSILSLLKRMQLTVGDIDTFFFHQPNRIILDSIAEQLGIATEKLPRSIEAYGNCSSASIPLVMCHTEADLPNSGARKKCCFCAFGGGLAVVSMLATIPAGICLPIVATSETFTW